MNQSSNDSATSSADSFSAGTLAAKIPAVVVFLLFVMAAIVGGEVADRGLLPLVRFISLLMLALGLYTSIMTSRYLTYSPTRWKFGQGAAALIGFSGGLVWSATAFGTGFLFFMVGTLVCALLVFKEMERHSNRWIARRKSNS